VKSFVWPVRVYYEDTDASGVVYYANYLKFMERARTEWLRSVGFEQDVLREQEGVVFVVRTIQLDYRQPARFNQCLEVHSYVQQARRVSVTFAQSIYNNQALLCRGQVQIASVEIKPGHFRPRAIPKTIVAQLEQYHAG